MGIKAEKSKDGKQLILTCDLEEPRPSKSGNFLTVATSRGWMQTAVQVDGRPVSLSLNAGVHPS